MRFLGILLAALIGLGAWLYFLKQAAPVPGGVATQAISTTAVEMDLNSIAQAERLYFAQNGSYADLDQLVSSGALAVSRAGRDGYTYDLKASGAGFTVTARHPDMPVNVKGAVPLHYPALSVDQSMQIRQGE
jgi:hypothetical protein